METGTLTDTQRRDNILADADNLHRLADWLASHATALGDSSSEIWGGYFALYIDVEEGDVPEFQRLVRLMPGERRKSAVDETFTVRAPFGNKAEVVLRIAREAVCTKRVVGTKTVTETVRDPAIVEAAPMVTITREVEEVEWECPPSIMGLSAVADDSSAE